MSKQTHTSRFRVGEPKVAFSADIEVVQTQERLTIVDVEDGLTLLCVRVDPDQLPCLDLFIPIYDHKQLPLPDDTSMNVVYRRIGLNLVQRVPTRIQEVLPVAA